MLALIPLDDRPCNVRFPQQLAAIGGDEIIVPPRDFLGRFNTPGQPEYLGEWLAALPQVEALIVSVDMLAYGGLVASRHPRVSVTDALRNLMALKQFRAERPNVPVYGFNILMRLAVTMDSDEAVNNYYNIMRYARLTDEAERFNSTHLREELEKVTALIPAAILEEYLAARARNHNVNGAMIDWLQEGVFDYLLITQEDAAEFGLHRREQDALLEHAQNLGVTDKMSLHPGADEAALTLLARHWNTGVSFQVHASSDADLKRIAPFEDRPFDEGLSQHVKAMRGQIVEDAPDFQLFVNAPVGGSQKDESEAAREARLARLEPFIQQITTALESGADVALCDVAFPNGADNLLMGELDKSGLFGGLTVFGGWNTAGNTTGTVLTQCAALKRAAVRGKGVEWSRTLSRQFTFERLVDDWYYQAQVRGRVEKAAREQGISPLNMGEQYAGAVESQTRRELRGFAQLLAKRHYNTTLRESEITLPWSRTFEADVRIKLA